MSEKQKTRDWKEIRNALAAFGMLLLLALWNVFANQDRQKVQGLVTASDFMPTATLQANDCSIFPFANDPGTGCSITVTSTRAS